MKKTDHDPWIRPQKRWHCPWKILTISAPKSLVKHGRCFTDNRKQVGTRQPNLDFQNPPTDSKLMPFCWSKLVEFQVSFQKTSVSRRVSRLGNQNKCSFKKKNPQNPRNFHKTIPPASVWTPKINLRALGSQPYTPPRASRIPRTLHFRGEVNLRMINHTEKPKPKVLTGSRQYKAFHIWKSFGQVRFLESVWNYGRLAKKNLKSRTIWDAKPRM